MKDEQKSILVPTNFSAVAEYGLQHAIRVSNIIKEPITILHIVENSAEIKAAQDKLTEIVEATEQKYGVTITPMVRVGSIFVDIAKVADEINADVVVMGSSTIKQMDGTKISWTLKVITSCKMPFIIIQEPPVNKRYDDIVFPIDFTSENRAKHRWIQHFSDYYLSRFHLIKPNTTDPQLLAKIDMNMASALRFLEEKGARYTIKTVSGNKPYEEEVLDAAVEIRADLIVLMTTPLDNNGNFTIDPMEQYILANARQIPVMCINPM